MQWGGINVRGKIARNEKKDEAAKITKASPQAAGGIEG